MSGPKWVLVPSNATEAMLLAAQDHNVDCGASMDLAYTAMLSARPAVPPEVVDAAARRIGATLHGHPDGDWPVEVWNQQAEIDRERYLKLARAAIAAMGWVK